jgi:hypothetical protein
MNRIDVIRRAFETNQGSTYLEIGVSRGKTFGKIEAPLKIAVDPHFRFWVPLMGRIRAARHSQSGELYYRMESDLFFWNHGPYFQERGLDVVLVDGLHAWQQAYDDVIHCAELLNDRGLIVMHDCSPATAVAAAPTLAEARAMPEYDGGWNGDVFKSVLELRARAEGLRVCVLNCDHGLGIVTQGEPSNRLDLATDEIDGMSFEELDRSRKELLDLRPPEAIEEILAGL